MLGEIGHGRAVEPLIQVMRNTREEDRDVRMAASRALGRIGDPRALAPLVEALKLDGERASYLRAMLREPRSDATTFERLASLLGTSPLLARVAESGPAAAPDAERIEPLPMTERIGDAHRAEQARRADAGKKPLPAWLSRYFRFSARHPALRWLVNLVLLALYGGAYVAEHPEWGEFFTLSGTTITWWLVIYAFVSSVLPVWLMLAPRDYLSTFLKIGTIVMLALGILVVSPDLQMPAMTKFVDGTAINPSGYVEDVDRRAELGRLIIKSEFLGKSLVNRYWGHFLGYGFTKPVDDLGPHNPASHPELLERLGKEFSAHDHDLRQLIRWITLSDAYALSSKTATGSKSR